MMNTISLDQFVQLAKQHGTELGVGLRSWDCALCGPLASLACQVCRGQPLRLKTPFVANPKPKPDETKWRSTGMFYGLFRRHGSIFGGLGGSFT